MKPVASMTGFASAARPTALGRLTLELRSVNSRFLDLSLKMPDDLRSTETAVRETITAQIARGKVECRLSVARGAGESEPQLNAAALQQLAALASEVARHPRATRHTFASHSAPTLDALAAWLSSRQGKAVGRADAAAFFGLLAGTLQLARATPDRVESDAILEAGVRAALRLAM